MGSSSLTPTEPYLFYSFETEIPLVFVINLFLIFMVLPWRLFCLGFMSYCGIQIWRSSLINTFAWWADAVNSQKGAQFLIWGTCRSDYVTVMKISMHAYFHFDDIIWTSWRLKARLLDHLFNNLFRLTIKKHQRRTSLVLCAKNSSMMAGFHSRRASAWGGISFYIRTSNCSDILMHAYFDRVSLIVEV